MGSYLANHHRYFITLADVKSGQTKTTSMQLLNWDPSSSPTEEQAAPQFTKSKVLFLDILPSSS